MSDNICLICGREGHRSIDCPWVWRRGVGHWHNYKENSL